MQVCNPQVPQPVQPMVMEKIVSSKSVVDIDKTPQPLFIAGFLTAIPYKLSFLYK